MLNNNRAQIAKTITWVVATLIIIVTLMVFIFISTQVSTATDWKNLDVKVKSFLSDEGEKISERIKTKNTFALSINENNKNKIMGWINEKS